MLVGRVVFVNWVSAVAAECCVCFCVLSMEVWV